MQQTVKERINEFIKFKKISSRAFESRCGLSNGYLRQLRNSPTVDKLEIILSAFPEINRDWLMSGEGDMLRRETFNITTGEVLGDGNMIGSPIRQIIGEVSGQNAGHDISNAESGCTEMWLTELGKQRILTEKAQSIAETAQAQLSTALAQITDLINQNKEQFNQFMGLLSTLKQV